MADQPEDQKTTMLNHDRVSLDAVLRTLGTGWYQNIFIVILALVYSTNSMYNVNYVFAVEDISYRCKVSQCDLNQSFHATWINVSDDLKTIKECREPMVDDSCSEVYNTSQKDCREWVYENPHSFVAEFNLACEDWKRTLVGTAHSFGNMIGLLFQGYISDRFGRKKAAILAGLSGGTLGMIKTFSSSYWMYLTIESLEGVMGDIFPPIFVLSFEMVEKKRALLYQLVNLIFYTLGLVLTPLIAWLVPYWRNFLRVIYAPAFLILAYSFFFDESVRWLLSKGDRERALQIIAKIARRNKVKLDETLLDKLEYVKEDKNELSNFKVLQKTFQSRVMMQRFLVCLVWWFAINLISYGMMINSVFIEGNKYLNFSLLLSMDFPANVVCWFVLTKYKRKLPLLVSFLTGGLFCICQPLVPKGYAWASLSLLMVFEMLATFSYNIVYISTSELFPTYTRNSMHSMCIAVGRIGLLIAPQMPLLITLWSGLPTLLFGVASLVAGMLTFLVPETSNTELPNTVAEAERIGAPVVRNRNRGRP